MPDYTILVVDYEPRSIAHFTRLFENAGYRVEVARDGLAGRTKFSQILPDLTLIEAMLPRKNGFDLCQELKQTEHGKQSPVLIITGVYKGRKYRWEARHHYGCDEFIEKPVEDERLLATVVGFLCRGKPTAVSAHEPLDLSADGAVFIDEKKPPTPRHEPPPRGRAPKPTAEP
jgi:DNA-binding response OmpR family regulator